MQNVILLIIVYYEKQIFPLHKYTSTQVHKYTSTQVHKYTLSAFAFLLSVFILFACNSQKQELAPVITQNAETGVQYKFIDLKMPRALAYLEELMNYDVAKPHNPMHNIKIDSLQLQIPAEWNEKTQSYFVNAVELHNAFNRLHHDVLVYNTRLDWGKQASHIVAVDLPEGKDVVFDTEQKIFSLLVQTWTTNDDEEETNVGGKVEQATVTCSFTQSWSFYQNVTCGGNNSGISPASKQLENKLNANCDNRPACKSGYFINLYYNSTYAGDPSDINAPHWYNTTDPIPGDYYMDQYLFERLLTLSSCISPAEMNFYLTGAAIIANNPSFKPANKEIIAYDFLANSGTGISGAYMYHGIGVMYGKCATAPPQP